MSDSINHSNRDTINVSVWGRKKKTNQLICGQAVSNNSLSALVYCELDPSNHFANLSERVYWNIHCDSTASCVSCPSQTGGDATIKSIAHAGFLTPAVSLQWRVRACGCWALICISDVIRPPFHMQISLTTWQSIQHTHKAEQTHARRTHDNTRLLPWPTPYHGESVVCEQGV